MKGKCRFKVVVENKIEVIYVPLFECGAELSSIRKLKFCSTVTAARFIVPRNFFGTESDCHLIVLSLEVAETRVEQ